MDHNGPIGLNSTEWREINQIGPKWTEVDLMDRSKSNGITFNKHAIVVAFNKVRSFSKKTIAISATVSPKSNKFEK